MESNLLKVNSTLNDILTFTVKSYRLKETDCHSIAWFEVICNILEEERGAEGMEPERKSDLPFSLGSSSFSLGPLAKGFLSPCISSWNIATQDILASRKHICLQYIKSKKMDTF